MKMAALYRAFATCSDITPRLIHTGQHYDERMSELLFRQLELPVPDIFLGINGGSQTQQTARIMLAFEEILAGECPDLVTVVGDVNSTLACALVAAKERIPILHVEAGLRSGDYNMPEEINRVIIDRISDELFVSEEEGVENLRKENIANEKIHFVGNVMIDSLAYYREKAAGLSLLNDLGLANQDYILVTMHRPANVDKRTSLEKVVEIIQCMCKSSRTVFAVHPRTKSALLRLGLLTNLKLTPKLTLLPPQGYLEFIQLMTGARAVVTDSGGIQEETTYLGVPCITLRENTERPVTVTMGTNYLIKDMNTERILETISDATNSCAKKGEVPPLWDGKASERILEIIKRKYIQ
jgi:UDP-N-acetylglucosamine 2-epimerase (non-hydrolysing)